MVKLLYNNIKIDNIGYNFFEPNCGFYFKIIFEKNFNF